MLNRISSLFFPQGEGCALMGRTNRFEQIVRSMTSVMDVPVTVKIRTGIFEDKHLAHTLVPRLRDWGVSMVTVSRGVVITDVISSNISIC